MKKGFIICITLVLIVCSSCTGKQSSVLKKNVDQTNSAQESKSTASSGVTLTPKSQDITDQIGRQDFEDIFVRKGDWIYTYPYFTYFPEGLYKSKILDNKNYYIFGQKYFYNLICNDKAESINVIGDQIYYINASDGNKIYTIRTDGTNRQKLLDMPAGYLYVSDNTMFFTDNSLDGKGNRKDWLYSARIDGSQLKCINPKVTMDIYISDGWIYFKEGKWVGGGFWYDDISKIHIDGTGKNIITKKEIWNIAVSGDWIYYNDMYKEGTSNLYKMAKDGTHITKITDDNLMCQNNNAFYFNWKVYGNWIFYSNASDGGKLYRINISGTDKKKLGDEKCTRIFLADQPNFLQVLVLYKLNAKQGTYKEVHIDKTTGEVLAH